MKKKADEYPGRHARLDITRREGGRISLRNLRTFRSLKSPVYRLFYGGMLGQMAPMNMEIVARSLLIYRLTGSPAILGGMSLIHAIPMLTLSLFGGVIADRVQKKNILFSGQIASATLSLSVALTLTLGYLSREHPASWWVLAVASLCQGTIMGLTFPSRQAIIREIVSETQLMNAVSLNMLGMNTLRLLAPAATGFLIDAFDFATVYYTMSALYFIAAVFFALMPPTGKIAIGGRSALAGIKEGFQYMRRENAVFLILVFSLIAIVLSMPYRIMMPIFTEDILKVDATRLGVLMSVAGAGAIVSSLFLASLPNKKRGFMLLVGSTILGLALAGFSLSSSWYLSLALVVFVGLGETARATLSSTLLQYYTVDEYRGRVMGIYEMEYGLMSFGVFAAGLIAEVVGAQWALGGFATVLVLLSVMALGFVPQLRKLD